MLHIAQFALVYNWSADQTYECIFVNFGLDIKRFKFKIKPQYLEKNKMSVSVRIAKKSYYSRA